MNWWLDGIVFFLFLFFSLISWWNSVSSHGKTRNALECASNVKEGENIVHLYAGISFVGLIIKHVKSYLCLCVYNRVVYRKNVTCSTCCMYWSQTYMINVYDIFQSWWIEFFSPFSPFQWLMLGTTIFASNSCFHALFSNTFGTTMWMECGSNHHGNRTFTLCIALCSFVAGKINTFSPEVFFSVIYTVF
jgi:hypothetical protein